MSTTKDKLFGIEALALAGALAYLEYSTKRFIRFGVD